MSVVGPTHPSIVEVYGRLKALGFVPEGAVVRGYSLTAEVDAMPTLTLTIYPTYGQFQAIFKTEIDDAD